MAIIQCPACGERVSNVARSCPKCSADPHSSDAAATLRRRLLRHQLFRARMGGYAALSVMVAAVLIWWIPSEGVPTPPPQFLRIVFALGAVGYVVSRYFIAKAERGLRELKSS